MARHLPVGAGVKGRIFGEDKLSSDGAHEAEWRISAHVLCNSLCEEELWFLRRCQRIILQVGRDVALDYLLKDERSRVCD